MVSSELVQLADHCMCHNNISGLNYSEGSCKDTDPYCPVGQRRRRALKINAHTRNELKIEAGNSQRALAGVKGITKLTCHISVKHKMQVRGEKDRASF